MELNYNEKTQVATLDKDGFSVLAASAATALHQALKIFFNSSKEEIDEFEEMFTAFQSAMFQLLFNKETVKAMNDLEKQHRQEERKVQA